MAEKQFLVDINLNKNELINARFQNLTTLPILSDPTGEDLNYLGLVVFIETTGYTYILKNIGGVATWDLLGSGSSNAVGGGIYVMGVSPNVSGENVTVTQSTDNEDITEVRVTNKSIKVNLLALTGPSSLKPRLSYRLGNSESITEIPLSVIIKNTDKPVYLVTDFQINATGYSSITFYHEDGASKTLSLLTETLPAVQSSNFIAIGSNPTSYPLGQTEVAEGNIAQLTITSDYPITKIVVYNEDACSNVVVSNATTNIVSSTTYSDRIEYVVNDAQYTKTLLVKIANRGDSVQTLGAVIAVSKEGGATSPKFYTNGGSTHTNGTHYLQLNNIKPLFGTVSVAYPNGTTAIKTDTTAIVTTPISNSGSLGAYTVLYSTSNGELSIPNTSTYELAKTVSTTWSGYNITTGNFTLTVTRTANGTTNSVTFNVGIASIAPLISISLPATRLISDVSPGKYHTITITSNQKLNSASLSAAAGGGSWLSGTSFTSTGGLIWTNILKITDDLVKGSYQFNNLNAVNIAGLSTTSINSGASYIIGGFTLRSLLLGVGLNTVSVPVALTTQAGDNTLTRAVVTWRGDTMNVQYPIGTAAPTDGSTSKPGNTWAASASGTNPTEIRLLNFGATQASTQETIVTIEEPA